MRSPLLCIIIIHQCKNENQSSRLGEHRGKMCEQEGRGQGCFHQPRNVRGHQQQAAQPWGGANPADTLTLNFRPPTVRLDVCHSNHAACAPWSPQSLLTEGQQVGKSSRRQEDPGRVEVGAESLGVQSASTSF